MRPPEQVSDGFSRSALVRSHLLGEAERDALKQAMTVTRTFANGAELLRERESAECIYILAAGWACRYKTLRDGGRHIPALLVAGDVCNVDSLLFDSADYGVRTLTEATAHVLPRDCALELCAAYPGIALTFTRLAVVDTLTVSRSAVCLGRQSARSRLAHLLCELEARLASAERSEPGGFELPLTQEQLADVLGLTSVHVNRTMQQLRAEGLIVSQGRTIRIPDIARLRGIGEFDPAYLHTERAAGGQAIPLRSAV